MPKLVNNKRSNLPSNPSNSKSSERKQSPTLVRLPNPPHVNMCTSLDGHYSTSVFQLIRKSGVRWRFVVLTCSWFLLGFLYGQTLRLTWSDKEGFFDVAILAATTLVVVSLISPIILNFLQHRLLILSVATAALFVGIWDHCIQFYVKVSQLHHLIVDLLLYTLYGVALFAMWNFTPRVLPSGIRCQGLGICLAFMQLGMLSSQLIDFMSREYEIYILIAATCAILPCCFMLHFVNGRELPDSYADVKFFKTRYKPVRYTALRQRSATVDEVEVSVTNLDLKNM